MNKEHFDKLNSVCEVIEDRREELLYGNLTDIGNMSLINLNGQLITANIDLLREALNDILDHDDE